MKFTEVEYEKTARAIRKDWQNINKDFQQIFADFERALDEQQDETNEDFAKRVKVENPISMRLIRKLWLVDSTGIVVITNINIAPQKKPKKSIWTKLVELFK